MRLRRLIAPMVALTMAAPYAVAQGTSAPRRIESQTYIAVNPLGVVGDIGALELETGVAQGITVGGVASYIDVSDYRLTTFDFKARYYPGEVVLRDWSIGGTVGFTRISHVKDTGDRQALSAPTIGLVVDKNWLTGRGEHFLIGTGVGAKRLLTNRTDRDRVDVSRAIFTARLVLGYAF